MEVDIENEPLQCSICLNTLKNPVLIPCGHSKCNYHQVNEQLINCRVCNQNHEVPPTGFIRNKCLESLIQRDIESTLKGKEYTSAMNVFGSFKDIYEEFKRAKSDPKLMIHEEISAMKTKVDLQREELKFKIDQEALELIRKLDEYEIDCLAKIEQNDQIDEKLTVWENELTRMRRQLAQFERDDEKFKDISKVSSECCLDATKKYKQYIDKLFLGQYKVFKNSSFQLGTDLDMIRNHSFDFKVERVSKLLYMPTFLVESDIYRAFGVDWSLCVERTMNCYNEKELDVYLNMNQLIDENERLTVSYSLVYLGRMDPKDNIYFEVDQNDEDEVYLHEDLIDLEDIINDQLIYDAENDMFTYRVL